MDELTRVIREGTAREQVDAGLVEVDEGVIHGRCNGAGVIVELGGSNVIARPCGCNRGWAQ